MSSMLLGIDPSAPEGAAGTMREECVTQELPKRDWLFPAILATLLAGSAISFVLAYAGGHIVPHQELRITSDHTSPRTDAEPLVLRVHGPSGK
ncbi:MAG: hypothetical protein JO188_06795 [Hyphomicrobiales bacterium]|nr:hypothetical protein [Hyphomicrobiales bacterium]